MYSKNLFTDSYKNSLIGNDVSYTQNEHPKSFNYHLDHRSLNGWSYPPISTSFSNHNNQDLTSSTPHQNYDPFNWESNPTQDHNFHQPPITEETSNYIPMGLDSYRISDFSNIYPITNFSEELMNQINSNQNFPMPYNTSFPAESGDISDIFRGFQENNMRDDVAHNNGLVTNIHEPTLDEVMVQSKPSCLPMPENIMGTPREIINQHPTSFPAEFGDLSDIFNGFQEKNMRDDVAHNNGLVTKIHEPTLDQVMVQSQSSGLPLPEDILGTTREIINQHQNKVIIKTDKQNNKRVHMRKDTPSKKTKIIKWKWTPTEDRILKRMVELNGTKRWTLIAKMFKGRTGKQCRERWHNHLRPDIKKDIWSEEENQILVEAHKVDGNKWADIAERLPGRSENTVKNHWNATKRQVQLMKTKKKVHRLHNNTLQNYIRYVTVKNNPIEAFKAIVLTENTKDYDDGCRDILDNEEDLGMENGTTSVANASTSENQFAEH